MDQTARCSRRKHSASTDLRILDALARALSDVLGPVRLADLIPEGHPLHALATGAPVAGSDRLAFVTDPTLAPGWTIADDKAAAALDLSPEDLDSLAHDLFGHTASTERDHRACGLNAPETWPDHA